MPGLLDIFSGAKDWLMNPADPVPNQTPMASSNTPDMFGLDKDAMGMLGMGLLGASGGNNFLQPLMMMQMLGSDSSNTTSLFNSNDINSNNYLIPSIENTIPRLTYAIGQLESGGKYGELGKQTQSGDRAYGRYQVMGSNIPSWTKIATGSSMSPQEFLRNPTAQDAVANYFLGKYYNQYGNINDAASMWFSGRPARGNTSRDILGTSVPQYIKTVNKYFYGY